MNAATDLLLRLKAEGLALITEMVESRWIETESLEFKEASKGTGPAEREDRRNLGIALSGFANGDGGIVIWGIRAAKEPNDDLDAATELKPIRRLRHFHSDLQNHTSQVVTPPILGVEHFEIPTEVGSDDGYLVTLIPRAEIGLHMATAAGQHTYYLRSASSFVQMSHAMIADRFSRRPKPSLQFAWNFSKDGRAVRRDFSPNVIIVSITVGLRNVGLGIARFPALAIHKDHGITLDPYGLDGNGNHGFRKMPSESVVGSTQRVMFAGGSDIVVYPGSEQSVTKLEIRVDAKSEFFDDIIFRYDAFCDGDSSSGEARISGEEILGLSRTLSQ